MVAAVSTALSIRLRASPVPHRSFRRLYTGMTTPLTSTDNQMHSDPACPLLVDVAKAATILAISRSSVYQLIWDEQLIPIRIGRSVRFSIAQLEHFVADRTSHGGTRSAR